MGEVSIELVGLGEAEARKKNQSSKTMNTGPTEAMSSVTNVKGMNILKLIPNTRENKQTKALF